MIGFGHYGASIIISHLYRQCGADFCGPTNKFVRDMSHSQFADTSHFENPVRRSQVFVLDFLPKEQ